jgi:cytochrome c
MLPEPSEIAQNNSAKDDKNEGLTLIEGADCLGCHKMDSKLVGPSYQEVANKYTEAGGEHQQVFDSFGEAWR